MIQQSTAPVAASWLTAPHESFDHGSGISVAAGVITFFKSLHPDYASGSIQMELPTLCADPPEKDYLSLLERTVLATGMVCSYVGLPATAVSCIGGVANFSAVVRWFGRNLAALGADNVASRDDEKQSPGRKKQRHRTCHQSARLPKTAIGLGAASCLGMVGAAPASGHERWIVVNDGSVLDKIGRDPAYPLDGRYRQLADIDAGNLSGPIGNTSHPFVGEYDGRCQSIDQLRHCLVQKLDGNGRIDNVRFTRADISSSKKVGVVACELSGSATLGNIVVEHSTVASNGTNAPAGIGAGVANNKALINGFSTFNCTTKTSGNFSAAGAVAGVARGTIDNTRLDNARVETFGLGSDAGGVAGAAHGSINNTMMIYGSVTAHGVEANAGGGAGVVKSEATVANTLLVRSSISTRGGDAYAAGGGGLVLGTVINTTMADGRVETSGPWAFAAVGAGWVSSSGKLINTTGQRTVIRTVEESADTAVGAGLAVGDVEGVVCFESQVSTLNGHGAIGAGWLSGPAAGTVAYECRVRTYGVSSGTGFGYGVKTSGGDFRNLTGMYSRVDASGWQAKEGINGGVSPFLCSASVGDKYESPPCCNHATGKLCLPVPKDACKLADPRVLTSDCRPVVPPYFDAEKGYDFVCPALPTPAAPVAAMSTAVLAGGIVAGVVVLGLAGVAGFALYRRYHQKNGTEEEMVRLINSDGL